MITKLVYVLVSEDSDYYYEMVKMSLHSFRLFHPHDIVELVMDEDTYKRLKNMNASIIKEVKPIVVMIPQEFSAMQRSRYLKTNLRNIIEGDYLFVDGDTIICTNLDCIDSLDADIAMVADCNKPLPLNDYSTLELNKRAGFINSENLPYFNSGVIYSKDTLVSYKLYKEWFELWKDSVHHGVSNDQPALCQANKLVGLPIKEISGIWNWQMFFFRPNCIANMKILHYYMAYEWKKNILKRVKGKEHLDAFSVFVLFHPRILCVFLYCKRKVQKFFSR